MAMRNQRFVQYHQRILELDPIAYWPLNEKQGNVAYDWAAENGARNGTHAGVTLGQPGIGDGFICPYFDGVNDWVDVQTAALAAAWNGDIGSVIVWLRMFSAGVWTDGAIRYFALFFVDGANYVLLHKSNAANQLINIYRAGGVSETFIENGVATIDWMQIVLTWDRTGSGNAIYYRNGAQVGAAQAIGGVWAGAPTVSLYGSGSPPPGLVTNGYIAHGAIFDYPLVPSAVQGLWAV
jgi:hypothetical protein